MGNPFVYYRIDSLEDLKRDSSREVCGLDWHGDLEVIRRFYARFTDVPFSHDDSDRTIGNPMAILTDGGIVSFAVPFVFHEGETEIGGVATVPERRNEGLCKALISEMAFRILEQGKTATLTTEKDNFPMRAAAEAIGMKETGRGIPD